MGRDRVPHPARDAVAVIIAIGLGVAVNLLCLAAVWDAIANSSGLSENATQVLTSAFGGMVGVLGAYLGFKAGERSAGGGEVEAPVALDDLDP